MLLRFLSPDLLYVLMSLLVLMLSLATSSVLLHRATAGRRPAQPAWARLVGAARQA